jgi:hypothetical protein
VREAEREARISEEMWFGRGLLICIREITAAVKFLVCDN